MRKRLFQFLFLLISATATAQQANVPSPPVIGAKSFHVTDATTGAVLASLNPDERLAPASLTKLMTAYAVFKALADGSITLEDQVTVSEKAWRTEGSRMFIEVGTQVTVEQLILGMIVQSGNDASVALAEHTAGSEDVFAQLMNQYAAEIGMQNSQFRNSTGLPDEQHFSTARDLALLAQAIVNEFPQYYNWYSVREYTYNDIRQPNRNSLLFRDDSVDGMKTGRTDAAGYCLVSSAKRGDMRVVSVVMGTSSNKARIDGSQALINYAFRFFETRLLYRAGEEISRLPTFKGQHEETAVGVLNDLYITFPRGRYEEVQSVLNAAPTLTAPIASGQPLATLNLTLGEETISQTELRAVSDNPAGSLWQRTRDSIRLWFE